MVSASDIESALDTVSAALIHAGSVNTTFKDVMKNATLSDAYLYDNAFYGTPATTAPSYPLVSEAVGQFINQYMTEHELRAVKKAVDSHVAVQLYEFYMRRAPMALFGLFQAASDLGKGYAGSSLSSSLLSDQVITPSFVQSTPTINSKLGTMSASFKPPTTVWSNALSITGGAGTQTSAPYPVGWVNNYFVINTSLPAGGLYTSPVQSPVLESNSAFIIFGVLDMKAQVDGISYSNADVIPSKPVYDPEASIRFDAVSSGESTARVIDNGLTLYVGKNTSGYVNIHFREPFTTGATTASNASLSADIHLLGQIYAISPIIKTEQF